MEADFSVTPGPELGAELRTILGDRATLRVQGELYWRRSAEVAAEVLQAVFCEGRRCSAERVGRFLAPAQRGPKLAGAPGEALAKGAAGLRRVAGASAALAGASEGGPSAR